MEIVVGLLIIAIGSLGQSSSYVPIKRVKEWSWESFWLVQGIFAWFIFPLVGSLFAIPDLTILFEILNSGGAMSCILYGMLWGIGGLTFGLSMRYLGISLGQSISLGTCAAFGTLLPAVFGDVDFLSDNGITLLIGVIITLVGISIIGYAGSLRSRNLKSSGEESTIKDFSLTKGLLVALLAGVMSACFSLGLESGESIKASAVAEGIDPLYAGLPVILLVTLGGLATNFAYCIYQNYSNNSFGDYTNVKGKSLLANILFCSLAGLLWYSQFFGLEMGKSFLAENPILIIFSWSILMSLNVVFSNMWGIILKEWKGSKPKTIAVLVLGLVVLISSIIVVALI